MTRKKQKPETQTHSADLTHPIKLGEIGAEISGDGIMLPLETSRSVPLSHLYPLKSVSRVYKEVIEDEAVCQFRESNNLQFTVISPTTVEASIQVINPIADVNGISRAGYLMSMQNVIFSRNDLTLITSAFDIEVDFCEYLEIQEEFKLKGVRYNPVGQLEFTTVLIGATFGQISDRADLLMKELHEQTMFLLS